MAWTGCCVCTGVEEGVLRHHCALAGAIELAVIPITVATIVTIGISFMEALLGVNCLPDILRRGNRLNSSRSILIDIYLVFIEPKYRPQGFDFSRSPDNLCDFLIF